MSSVKPAWQRAQDREIAKMRRMLRWHMFRCNVRQVYFTLRLRWVQAKLWMLGG